MANNTLIHILNKIVINSWRAGYQFATRPTDSINSVITKESFIYTAIEEIRSGVEELTKGLKLEERYRLDMQKDFYDRLCVFLKDPTDSSNFLQRQYEKTATTRTKFKITAMDPDGWLKLTALCKPASRYIHTDYLYSAGSDKVTGYGKLYQPDNTQQQKHIAILKKIAFYSLIYEKYNPKPVTSPKPTPTQSGSTNSSQNASVLNQVPEYVKYIKVLLNFFVKRKDYATVTKKFTENFIGVPLPLGSHETAGSYTDYLELNITEALGFSPKAAYDTIIDVLDIITIETIRFYHELGTNNNNTIIAISEAVLPTSYSTKYLAEKANRVVPSTDTTVYPQTPKTPADIVKDLTTIVAKGDLEGSKAALVQIDGLLNSYSGEGGANKALRSQLIDLRNKFQYAVNKRTQELGGTTPPVTPPVNKTTNPNNQGTKTDVKNAVEAAYKQGGVEAAITQARGYNSTPISQAVKVEFYEEDEPIEVQPATARIILKDPLTDTPNLDYPTNLIDTDLNDFRRAQLVLPYSVGEGSAKLSWFKLSTNPAVRGITEQSTGGPTLENIFGNNASYNQFFLKGLEESRNEKFQLVDTPAQGQTLFSFGEKPEFWTIRGQLLNDSINDWTNKFRVAWINHMRLNQLTRTGRYMEVHIPAIRLMFTCYPVALSLSHADESETVTNFAMMVFKRSEKVLPNLSYTKQDAKAAMLNTLLSLDNKSVLLEVPTKGNLAPIDHTTGKPYTNISAEPTTSKEVTTRIDRATQGGESGADGSGKVLPPRPPQKQLAPFQKKLDNRRS